MSTGPVSSEYLGRKIFRTEFKDPAYGSGANDIVARAAEAGPGIGSETGAEWDYREIINGHATAAGTGYRFR